MKEPGVHGVTKSRTRLSDFTSRHFSGQYFLLGWKLGGAPPGVGHPHISCKKFPSSPLSLIFVGSWAIVSWALVPCLLTLDAPSASPFLMLVQGQFLGVKLLFPLSMADFTQHDVVTVLAPYNMCQNFVTFWTKYFIV